MDNGQNLAQANHLEDVANGAKRYILAEILDVTNAVATELENINVNGGASYADFTGATSIAGGASGLVPAPSAGDENNFLRGDGTWASVSSGGTYLDFTGATASAGGVSGLVPAPAAGDESKFLRGDGSWSNGVVLSTVPATVDGGLWYEIVDGELSFCLRKDGINYKIRAADSINSALAAYLPFDKTTTADKCNNTWVASGSPALASTNAITGTALQLSGTNYLRCDTPIMFGGADFTFDCYGYINSSTPNYSALIYSRSSGTVNHTRAGEFHLGNNNGKMVYVRCDANGTYTEGASEKSIDVTITDALHHFAVVYTHENTTTRIFVDGVCQFTETDFEIPRMTRWCFIGTNEHNLTKFRLIGSIDEFRIHDGLALWTENFTPPTASDYL